MFLVAFWWQMSWWDWPIFSWLRPHSPTKPFGLSYSQRVRQRPCTPTDGLWYWFVSSFPVSASKTIISCVLKVLVVVCDSKGRLCDRRYAHTNITPIIMWYGFWLVESLDRDSDPSHRNCLRGSVWPLSAFWCLLRLMSLVSHLRGHEGHQTRSEWKREPNWLLMVVWTESEPNIFLMVAISIIVNGWRLYSCPFQRPEIGPIGIRFVNGSLPDWCRTQ